MGSWEKLRKKITFVTFYITYYQNVIKLSKFSRPQLLVTPARPASASHGQLPSDRLIYSQIIGEKGKNR